MRLNNTLGGLALGILLTVVPCLAALAEDQEGPTLHQSYQRALELFAQGHSFTADELLTLEELETQLRESDEASLASDLALVRMGTVAQTAVAEGRDQAAYTLAEDRKTWSARQRTEGERGIWRGIRDTGLVTFGLSAVGTLVLSTLVDRYSAVLDYGKPSDAEDRIYFKTRLQWALFGSATTMFVSLFPMLIGESHL